MSKIEVNTVDVKCGSTLTLGSSGKTVTIASGASTSGMGRTGTVDWKTGSIKTESFTGVNGEGYFIDTLDSGSPFKNYAVTVATGTLYIVGGSGNVFNLDGSQQTAITLMKGKTYRFTQSDNTNDGHQLIISTSNSTTLGTFQAGIVSSGITYYIDGSATQSNWLNSTTFNAGTTRYIEFQPQATGTFYFGCYNHGIGMGGAITSEFLTLNLPAGSAGNIISVADYTKSFSTNSFRIKANGSEKIGGLAEPLTLDSENGTSITLVYVDSTKGWVNTQFSAEQKTGVSYTSATGGNTVATNGNFKIHTFTGPGTFTVCTVGSHQDGKVDYLVVAGGGSGAGRYGGGGGGGGFRESSGSVSCYSSSPLGNSVSALTVTATGYPITVGAGGANVSASPGTARGNRGSTSTFSSISSTGGGGGGGQNQPENPTYMPGGSGGGNSYNSPSVPLTSGTGNTPPVSPPQGQPGGVGYPGSAPYATGGGGGATEAGVNAASGASGRGGAGASTAIVGSSVAYAGGGGGSASNDPNSPGAASPCGTGGNGGSAPSNAGGSGTTNKGGGGGGAYHPSSSNSGSGGSGVVIIRYRYQ